MSPRVAAGVSPCPGKAGARGRAQEPGSLGRSLYLRRSNSGSGWWQASTTALRSPGTGWHGTALLQQIPPAAPAPLSPGLDFPGAGPREPAVLRRAGLTPNTHPGDPRRGHRDPMAGQGRASAGAGGCSEVAKHRGWPRGVEGLPPHPCWCRGWGWQVPVGCSGWGWQVPVGCSGQEGGVGHPGHPLLRKRCSVLGPERRHPKANADSRGRGGAPAGLGGSHGAGGAPLPWGRRPVSANEVCIIKAGSFGLVAPVLPSPGGQQSLGRRRGGQGGLAAAGQCLGGRRGR